MAIQRIARGFPFPIYVNETDSKQHISRGVYFNETIIIGGITIIVDTIGSLEILAGLQNDSLIPVDFQFSIKYQSTFPLETLASVVATERFPFEELASVVATIHGVEENLASAQGLWHIPVSFETTVKATQRVPVEWAGTITVQVDAISPLAWEANLTGTSRLLLEENASLRATSTFSIEELASVQATIRAPVVELANVVAITHSPLEWGGALAVTIDQASPLEWRTGVQGTTRAWIDEQVGLSVQSKFLVEQLATVPAATQRALLGIGASVVGTAKGQLAWAVTVNGTIRAWVEWAGVNAVPFTLDPEYHLKALVSTTALKAPANIVTYKVPVSITALKALLS